MSESTSYPSEASSISDIVTGLHEKQREILVALATAPPELDGVSQNAEGSPTVRTSFLTRATEYPNNTVGHHTKALIRSGLVERVEAVEAPDSPGRLTPNAYRCTEKGRSAAEIVDSVPMGDSLEALHVKLERQQQEIDTLHDTIDTLEEKFGKIATGHNILVDELEDEGILD